MILHFVNDLTCVINRVIIIIIMANGELRWVAHLPYMGLEPVGG